MKNLFIVLGIIGIVASVVIGFTSFTNATIDFVVPFILICILLSILIIEVAYMIEYNKGEKNEK